MVAKGRSLFICSAWSVVISGKWSSSDLLVSISPPFLSRPVYGAVIRVRMVDSWQIRAFRLVTFLLASRSILSRGWKMQRRAAAQLQMNGAICLVTRGRRERLQPNCTWSPVLTPARRFPLQGKKQRGEGERNESCPIKHFFSPSRAHLTSHHPAVLLPWAQALTHLYVFPSDLSTSFLSAPVNHKLMYEGNF